MAPVFSHSCHNILSLFALCLRVMGKNVCRLELRFQALVLHHYRRMYSSSCTTGVFVEKTPSLNED
jgi:hypothetical protein